MTTTDRTVKHSPLDALKYAAAIVRARIEWTTAEIGGSGCDCGHDTPLDALADLPSDIIELVKQFSDTGTYSDGRQVKTEAQIETGVYTQHVWHPDPTAEEPRSWTGHLHCDPGVPSPGVYKVTTDPATQVIDVQVLRLA